MDKKVCIVHMVEWSNKGWQVMKRNGSGFFHVFPGITFTLDEARDKCVECGFDVVAVAVCGNVWRIKKCLF